MSPFWYTVDTMRSLYGYDYHAFELFGPLHLCWLGLCAAVCCAGFFLYRRLTGRARHRVLAVLTVLLLADEVIKYIASLATGQFVWQFLPLHMCSINLFICLWYTLRPNAVAAEVLYALCLPGALAALLFPSWQAVPLWNIMHLHSSTIHVMLILYPVLLLAGGFRPSVRRLPAVFGVFCLDALAAATANHFLGTNFMFLQGAWGNGTLELIERAFGPFYLLGLLLIVLAVWAVMYAPWALAAAGKKRKTVKMRR